MKPRTVLIGLDGATFHILDSMTENGIMPFLKDFVSSGVRANLITVVPPLTPPAWTSMMTGRSPSHHGIFDFFQKDRDGRNLRFPTHQEVRCETVWSIANRSGARTTVLNFPLMMPPPDSDGYVIAGGWITRRQLSMACYPDSLYETLKKLPGFVPKDLTLEMAHEAKALEGCRDEDYAEYISFHIRREQQWFNILKYLMREDPCELTAVLFDGIDKLQHLCWRYISPDFEGRSMNAWERNVKDLCREYFARLDRILQEIVALAGPAATVVMLSDHGFNTQRETFFANAWLEEKGYLKWAADPSVRWHADGILGMKDLAKHVYMLDWNNTRAYVSTPSSNGIHIVRSDDTYPNGIAGTAYEDFRAALIEKLKTITSSISGSPLISKIWTREEAFEGPYMELAPDLTLMLHDGGLVSILPSDVTVKPLRAPRGSHHMEGVFIARGPGIKKNLSIAPLSILDAAPLLLYSLGMAIPGEMEGQVPEALFETSHFRLNPVNVSETARKDFSCIHRQKVNTTVFDDQAQAKLAEHLRALGYIE